jgi:hypothetical protein
MVPTLGVEEQGVDGVAVFDQLRVQHLAVVADDDPQRAAVLVWGVVVGLELELPTGAPLDDELSGGRAARLVPHLPGVDTL